MENDNYTAKQFILNRSHTRIVEALQELKRAIGDVSKVGGMIDEQMVYSLNAFMDGEGDVDSEMLLTILEYAIKKREETE